MIQMASYSRSLLFLLIFSLLAATACKRDNNDPYPEEYRQEAASLRFEEQEFYRVSSNCTEDTTYCARISASYPMLVSGPADVVQAINDTILHHVKASIAVFAVEPAELAVSLDSIASQYIREFELLLAESPDYPSAWEIQVDGEVLHQTPKVVSISLNSYSYTGGAHPNSAVDLLNFEVRGGKKLTIDDVFTDQQKLKDIVEQKFRQVREIPAGESMSNAGYFWGEPFSLPQNFALRKDGVYFFYNPYEVAAYAAGPTDFTIPYDTIAAFMKVDVQ